MNKPYSSHANSDESQRLNKARKILAVLMECTDVKSANILDIGTGSGHIAHEMSQKAGQVVSVDVSDQRTQTAGYDFYLLKGDQLPFEDGRFDIVVSNQVIEHTPNQQRHMEEIHRVLKPGGIAYLATPNRFTWMEPHFRLPLLSWLPPRWATAYLKMFKNRTWDVYPLSLNDVKRLTADKFVFRDMTKDILKSPEKYFMNINPRLVKLIGRLPDRLLNVLMKGVPSFIIILRKEA